MSAETMENYGLWLPEEYIAEIEELVDEGLFTNQGEAVRYSIAKYRALPWRLHMGKSDEIDELLYSTLEEPDTSIVSTVETRLEETRVRREEDIWRCEGTYGSRTFSSTGFHPELAYDNMLKRIAAEVRNRAEEHRIV